MSFVESALRDANVDALDARGLMPITRAREVLGAARVVDRETLDEIWAAMLSLATPEELVAMTKHLEWQMPVRGMDNLALVERYGSGALAWIASRVHNGVLINHPWCVVPCLLALGEPAALDLMLSIRGAVTDGGSMKFWQFTPADIEGDAATLEQNALDLVVEWARRHPDAAATALAARANHPRAAEAMRIIAAKNELSVERILSTLDAACRAEVGTWPWFNMGVDGRCEYYGLRLIAVRSRSGNGWGIVLERMMGCDFESLEIARYAYGPGTTNSSEFENGHRLEDALRLLGNAEDEEGDEDDDGADEDVESDDDDVNEDVVDSDEEAGDDDEDDEDEDEDDEDEDEDEDAMSAEDDADAGDDGDDNDDDDNDDDNDTSPVREYDEDRPPFTGMTLRGPDGDLLLDESIFAKYDLRPGWVTESGGFMDRTLAIRAYLAAYPESSLWPSPEEALAAAGVPDGEILVVSTSFQHASGNALDGTPPQPWHVMPSQSSTYRSLAEAIVARDATRFVPGASNLDWRLHATEREDGFEPAWSTHRFKTDDGYLRAAMYEAAVTCDERGLMPLAEARAIAAQTNSLARGDGRYVDETWVWDLDRTWAALLSLADANEAAAFMRKLELVDPPRDAAKNRALVERYGDGALALVNARADGEGIIQASSPILRATVLSVGTAAGFAFVWDIKGWNEPADDGEEAASPDAQATALFTSWMSAYPELGFVELARRTRAGDQAAASYLQSWAAPQVRRVYRWLAKAFGDTDARAILQSVGHSCDLAPAQILSALDAAAQAGNWPKIVTGAGPSRELHAMRLIAARARGSEDWVIVIERFEGYTFHNCRVDRYVYGENTVNGLREDLRLSFVPPEFPQLPALAVDALLVERPDYWTKIDNAPAAIAHVRAVLRAEPTRFFGPPAALLAQLGISDPAFVIVTMELEHTVDDALPSTLASFRSLADVLVSGNAASFSAGKPNNWYAPHAKSVEQHEAESAAENEEEEEDDDDDDEGDDDDDEEEDDEEEDEDEG